MKGKKAKKHSNVKEDSVLSQKPPNFLFQHSFLVQARKSHFLEDHYSRKVKLLEASDLV